MKKEEPTHDLDDPTVGDETLVHLGDAEYAHAIDDAANEGGRGGTSPALDYTSGIASTSRKVASERILDKVRLTDSFEKFAFSVADVICNLC